jgi:hypothetical protein
VGDSFNQLPCVNAISGYSLARNYDGIDSDSADDWFSCANISPGSSNVIERLVSLQNSKALTSGTSIDISTVILNLSTWDVDNSELSIKILFNSELKHFEDLTEISGGDSLIYCTAIENEFLESGLLEVELISNSNIILVDNLWEKWINYQSPLLSLSEIMYYPLTNQTEWVEVKLLNDIAYGEMTIVDASGNKATSQISGFTGDYIVIAEDRSSVMHSFPTCDSLKVFQAEGWSHLNNTGDLVLIKYFNTTLDSLLYEANSTPAGYSWECTEENNEWARSNSAEGATPTESNSITHDNPTNYSAGLKIISNLISIKKDKQLVIQFNSQKLVNSLDIQLFDIRGKELSTITTHFSNQYSGDYCWDGCLNGRYLTSGLYPTIVKIKAENGRVLEEKKTIITINR